MYWIKEVNVPAAPYNYNSYPGSEWYTGMPLRSLTASVILDVHPPMASVTSHV